MRNGAPWAVRPRGSYPGSLPGQLAALPLGQLSWRGTAELPGESEQPQHDEHQHDAGAKAAGDVLRIDAFNVDEVPDVQRQAHHRPGQRVEVELLRVAR